MAHESVHPEHIGSYTVESRLGAGGMGTVYLGRHDETGEMAAVKVLPASLAREEGFVARFEREVQSLQKVTNPHIVKFLEAGVDGDRHYYAMEYVQGETITERLHRERRIPWPEVIHIAIQTCSALKAAHDAGIIHRDLKPSNLMLRADGAVKLTDFGIAHVFAGRQLTATGGIIGTAEFMSPEQAAGKRVTKQSDLYSLGAVIYVMLTGRPPFTGKTAHAVIRMHLNDRFDSARTYVPDIPYWLDELVDELLEKDPEKRPPDAFVLQRRLQSILAKVELAAAESPTRTAIAANELTAIDAPPEVARGPGAPTLMRDLVKAEVERAREKSRIGRLLDNGWVLAGLLVGVVALTVMLAQWNTRTEGLSDADADAGIRPFLQRAQRERTAGNPAAAERTLLSLIRLIEETGEFEDALDGVNARLEAVRRQLAADDDRLLEAALVKLADRIEKGQLTTARFLLESTTHLYADDPRALARIERLRRELDERTPE